MTTRNTSTRTRTAALLTGAAMALVLQVLPPQAYAATVTQSQAAAERDFNIAAGPLDVALTLFSQQSGVQLVYDAELVRDRRAPAVRGRMAPEAALARLLAGQTLTSRSLNASTITIERDARIEISDDGSRVLGPVRVEGANPGLAGASSVNGINGSRDVTATEGTDSFTTNALTIASREPRSFREAPASISALTYERLQEQNITDFTSALAELPGVALVQGSSSLESEFYSRGFQIGSFQLDGGAPLSLGRGFQPQIDFAQYDHIELIRGAAGVLNGYGDPSGVINLVRKKPLDHSQVLLDLRAGSWNNYRAMIDASAPLAFDGRLRGRAVFAYQANEQFYDLANDKKAVAYGVLELDLTSNATISGGVNFTRQDSRPFVGGLPRFQNGDDLGLPRNTAFVFPWNEWNFETLELFGSATYRFNDGWNAKLSVTSVEQSSENKTGNVFTAVTPGTNAGPRMSAGMTDYSNRQLTADLAITGKFSLFGGEHLVTLGGSYAATDGGDEVGYGPLIVTPYRPYAGGPVYCVGGGCPVGSIPLISPPVNVFSFNPHDPIFNEPADSLPSVRYNVNRQVQSGLYAQIRLNPTSRIHVDLGVRYSRYSVEADSGNLCTVLSGDCAGRAIGDQYNRTYLDFSGEDLTETPSVAVTYDLSGELSAYAAYSDIYVNQSRYLTVEGEPVEPITGSNREAGLKFSRDGGRINASISYYDIEQTGFNNLDFNAIGFNDDGSMYSIDNNGVRYQNFTNDAGVSCCYTDGLDYTQHSYGVEAEITGRIGQSFDLAANITYGDNELTGDDVEMIWGPGFGGARFFTRAPKTLYKLWARYRFDVDGPLRGAAVSIGVNGQSSAYTEGTTCVRISVPNAQGVSNCLQSEPFNFTVPAYSVFSGRLEYDLGGRWSVALNAENMFDRRYYQTSGSTGGGNWYGSPRSFSVNLMAKW